MQSKNEKSPLDDYMFRTLASNIDESKRAEGRSDKAIQLFLSLLTAIFGAIIVIYTNVQDVFLKYLLIAFALLIITSFGILTFSWIVVSNMFRQELAMERFHLFQYFHDQDPITFDKYGQNIYSLNIHRPHVFPEKSPGVLSFAISLSLVALIVFNTLAVSSAIYIGMLAFSLSNIVFSVVIGLLTLSTLVIIWRTSQKKILSERIASQNLVKKYNK